MSIRHRLLRIGSLMAALLLTACSANHKSIFRHERVTSGASITLTDAKQRAILSNRLLAIGAQSTEQTQRFCAEASPDVFAVIAQSLSVGGTFGQQADPKAIEVALNAAFASSEQASTIPRTQTINMLRELMYRTCERYLNGGIGSLELPLQAIRDQRLMVSILAIEQLTGAVASKAVMLGAIAQANAGASTSGVIVELGKARDDVQAKEKARDIALAAHKGVTVTIEGNKVDACTQIDNATTDESKNALHADVKAKAEECKLKKVDLQKKEDQFKAAKDHYETVEKIAREGGQPVGSKAEVVVSSPGLPLERVGGASSIDSVASVVKAIVFENFQQDEYKFLCLKLLSPDQPGGEHLNSARASCEKYLNKSIEAEAEGASLKINERQLEQQLLTDELTRLQATSSAQFETFWRTISNDAGTAIDASKYQRVKERSAKVMRWPTCFTESSTKDMARDCFRKMVEFRRQDLIRSATQQ
jgi:hypothetical protein